MRRIADCEVICACVEHISAVAFLVVIAREVGHIDVEGHGFGSAGRKLFGLFVVDKLNCGLFNAALFIGHLCIELNYRFSRNVARVCNFHCSDCSLMIVGNVNVYKFLSKFGVRKAVTEGIGNFLRIYPLTVGGCGHKRHVLEIVIYIGARLCGDCVARVSCKEAVGIPRLIVTVARVDTFSLNEVRVYVHTVVTGSIGPVCTGGIRIDKITIPVIFIMQAVVHHCGSESAVYRIDVAEVPGRIYVAEKGLGNCRKAVDAGVAYPHNGVDLGILFKALDIHLVGGVDQHDHIVRASLCFLYNRPFFVAYAEDIAAVGRNSVAEAFLSGIECGTLAAYSAENDDRRVAVIAVVELVAGDSEFGKRGLCGIGRAVEALILGCLCAEARAAPREIGAVVFISLDHCGIHVEHFLEVCFESALVGVVVYYALIGNGAAGGAAVIRRIAAYAEQRYLGPVLVKGQ